MNTPSLNEWKRLNPGKGINEYFIEFPETENQNLTIGNIQNNSNPNQIILIDKRSNISLLDIGSMIFSIVIIVAFFLPWIDVKLFTQLDFLNIKGYELPEVLNRISIGFPKESLYSIYAIPIGALVTFIASSQKSWMKVGGEFVVILITIYWYFLLNNFITINGAQFGLSIDPFNFFSLGIYLTFIGAVYYVIDMIREIIKMAT